MAEDRSPADQAALVPIREQQIDFYGDTLRAAQLADETILVPLRPIVEALGLDWSAQSRRVRRDSILAEGLRSVAIMATEGYPREVLALPLELLPGWLFGISTARVKPELQEKITRYRRECFRVLWNAFKGDVVPTAPAPLDLSPVEQALMLAEAVASMAREHLALDQRVTTIADYTRGFIQQTKGHQARTDARLTALELRLSSGATISEAQAAEIAGAVKAVAMRLTVAGDANGFGKVWGELYRRFRVTSYHNLPSLRYDEALTWLNTWYDDLQGA